jgi:hypothetical protein
MGNAAAPLKRPDYRLLGVGLMLALILFAGFAKNFYLRSWLATRPITAMVVLHGVIMSAWAVLFLVQVALIAQGRLAWHRRLGASGAVLAILIVVLGVYTIYGSIVRQHLAGDPLVFAWVFVAFDGVSLLLFGALVGLALRVRLRPPTHKRLMVMAMISLLPPAYGRLAALLTRQQAPVIVWLLMTLSVLLCIGVDTAYQRRAHAALLWSGAAVIVVNALTYWAQMTS